MPDPPAAAPPAPDRQVPRDLIARVLAFQREFVRNWGREPSVEDVVRELEGPR